MSARKVAEKARVAPAYLSRLERGHLSPTVATLTRIVDALGEPLGSLFEGDTAGPLVRKHERRVSQEKGVTDSLLSPSRDGRLEVMETIVDPGEGSGDAYTHWGEEECVTVLDGSLEIWVGDDAYVLEEGDALTFSCLVPHRWRNPGPARARVFWIITPGQSARPL